jgi:4-amino-4-deoxy-L-arabinose transferase-like glycosyltransferase
VAGLSEPEFLERPALHWSVLILIAILFAITNLPWHLDDYDQAKQAFTSFEMVNEGHWFYQDTPNEKIATKPPLVGWVSAGCYAVTRSWDVAWRLPSIAAAFLLLVALRRAAMRAYGTAAALLAVGAFGLNLLAPRLATLVRTDMPLALVVFLLGLKIWEKISAAAPWNARDRLMIFALLTAAMLIKGPIVYAFLLPGIAAFQLLKRDDKISAWCGWWPWIASLAIFALWVAGGIKLVPGFYEQVVLKEFAGRFGETIHRPQPLFFYLPHLLQKFAPWSLLSLGLGIAAWRAGKRNLSPDILWLLLWSLGGLLVMSLIPSKRVDRIFPIVPPLCLLIAAQFSPQSASIRRWSAIALILADRREEGLRAVPPDAERETVTVE